MNLANPLYSTFNKGMIVLLEALRAIDETLLLIPSAEAHYSRPPATSMPYSKMCIVHRMMNVVPS